MSRKLASFMVFLAAAGLASDSKAQEGRDTFRKHCSHCHAPEPDRPGTLQLALTRGEANAVLEERDNLSAAYVKLIVRQGLNAMPPFKPTTVTEQELDALAAYLDK